MKIYKLLLLLAVIVLVGACTPMARDNNDNNNNNTNTATSTDSQNDQNMEDSEDTNDLEDSDDTSSAVQFLNYENKAVGYTINIPTTWYWQHFIKSQIGEPNPLIDDYLFISPTKPITTLRTEVPGEIMVEVSNIDITEFNDDSLSESKGTISGQEAVRAHGTINNELFDNYRKIEYRFTKDGRTFRILYMAPAGMEENERIFEKMVQSFKFS